MWAKIAVIHCEQKIVYLPSSFAAVCGSTSVIRLGGRSAAANIEYRDDLLLTAAHSYDAPGRIELSDKLRDEILLAEPLVYRVRIDADGITLGPVIGLLLGEATERYNPSHMAKYSDRFGVYHRLGGLIYAFSPKFIQWKDRTAYGLYYNTATATWEYGRFPLPEVIYRRDFHSEPEIIAKLIRYTHGRLFNSYRFTKYELYDFIQRDDRLRKYLPPTEHSSGFEQLKEFIGRHRKVILKPVHLSRGRGICIIEKKAAQYQVIDFRCKHPLVYQLYNERFFENFCAVYQDLFDKYLVQKYLPLAQIAGAPFDIRAVMQKRPDRSWLCAGIECRVSNNGYLTNISRGGYALPLDEALRKAFGADDGALPERIDRFCDDFCQYMDTLGEHFAEFGLDIAIDTDKQLWLIEANVFPSFKGFKTMDHETYLGIRYNPMLYAASLTQFGE